MIKIDSRPAILMDISKEGIKLSSAIVPTTPEVNIEIKEDNQVFKLKGKVRWITRKVSFQNLKEIGIFIEEAPIEYYQYIDKLSAG